MEYGLIFHVTRIGITSVEYEQIFHVMRIRKYYCKNMRYRINIYIYHSYYGNSHVIKVIISLLNFLIIPALLSLYFLWYIIVIPWQHRDYRMITALSLGLRTRESGQLSTIIPQNHGITITYMFVDEKIFESYFRDRLTFSNIRSRTSR